MQWNRDLTNSERKSKFSALYRGLVTSGFHFNMNTVLFPKLRLISFQYEVLASRHRDDNSAACVVDKCFVLSYPQYCR